MPSTENKIQAEMSYHYFRFTSVTGHTSDHPGYEYVGRFAKIKKSNISVPKAPHFLRDSRVRQPIGSDY